MLGSSDIPRDGNGVPSGRFRLRLGTRTEVVPGARFVAGVTVQPVDGPAVARLVQAYGPELVIEPWDKREAQNIAEWHASRGNRDRSKAILEASAKLFRGRKVKPAA